MPSRCIVSTVQYVPCTCAPCPMVNNTLTLYTSAHLSLFCFLFLPISVEVDVYSTK